MGKYRNHTPEAKEKMRKAALGKKISIESRIINSIRQFGKKMPESFIEKNRNRMIGNKYCVGKKHTEEFKENRKKSWTGKNNPNWNNGSSRSYKTGYYSPKYKNWRMSVFTRDSFTCQECGVKHTYLTAHHIKSFAYYPQLRFELDNGITLCQDCHKKTDNYGGRKCVLK